MNVIYRYQLFMIFRELEITDIDPIMILCWSMDEMNNVLSYFEFIQDSNIDDLEKLK